MLTEGDRKGVPWQVLTKEAQSGAAASLADRLATNVPNRSSLRVSGAISLGAVLGPVAPLRVDRSVRLLGGPLIWTGGVESVVVLLGKSLSDLVRLTRADVLEGRDVGGSRALRLGELVS
jgi:hypothetical protein